MKSESIIAILEKIILSEKSIFHKATVAALAFSSSMLVTFIAYKSMNHYFPTIGVLAVISIALYCGLLPSLFVALAQRCIAAYFFILPAGFHFTLPEIEQFFISIVLASCVTLLATFLRSSLQNTMKAKQEAEQARLLMERMLALVSHDVRNPLAAIKISTQLILRTPGRSEQHQAILARMLNSVEFADSMIQSLLDVSRMRAGKKLPLAFQACDLRIQVAQMIDEISLVHNGKINFNASGSVNGAWGTIGIRRVLENLISNAVKYGEPNSTISVNLIRFADQVKLSVHNSGPEIPAREQRKLFIEFERTRSSESSSAQGWGLGLALVKGIAEAHSGTVTVESSIDKGTTFTLELPIRTLEQCNNSQCREQDSTNCLISPVHKKNFFSTEELSDKPRL